MGDQFPPNSHRSKAASQEEPKRVERVTANPVARRERPLGKRLSETFFGGDARSVAMYVIMEVLVPALKDTITDMVSQGVERMVYGESRTPRGRRPSGSGGYINYSRYATPSTREYPRTEQPQGLSRRARTYHEFDELVLATRYEAEEVLSRLSDLISRYDSATVGDLYELVGEEKTPIDERWGWTTLGPAEPKKLRGGGYTLNLPYPEEIN